MLPLNKVLEDFIYVKQLAEIKQLLEANRNEFWFKKRN
jgi:hypothetical protein